MTGPGTPGWDDHPELLPPEPDLEPLHARDYSVRAYRLSDQAMLLRGAVMDIRPGASVAARIRAAGGTDDGRPMPIHHMILDLTVSFPELTITAAEVVFETFPQLTCPSIAGHYQELVGLSIARGFTHEVRRRFGGPRGCSHTTALLQAMAPVALQSVFTMRRASAGTADAPTGGSLRAVGFMKDTCHVWAEDGDIWQGMRRGTPPPQTLAVQERMRAAGLDPAAVDLR
ncbi:MAG: DUF2889 domain-containing protein [Acidobacteriota bacterium]|nr:DUF2889 domain-containing protein [Acidobacteriota bacterium]